MAQDNKKPKLVRDSFTIPKTEYAAIEQLKQRTVSLGGTVKKSELLRAGLMLLQGLNDAAFKRAINAVPTLKTGRPTAEQRPEPASAAVVVVTKPATPIKKTPTEAVKPTAPRAAPAKTPVARKAAVKPAAKSVTQPAANPPVKTSAKPAVKAAVKPAVKVVAKPVEKAADKPIDKAAAV